MPNNRWNIVWGDGKRYEYETSLVETDFGPERTIRLTRKGDWETGPSSVLSEAMLLGQLIELAIKNLEE